MIRFSGFGILLIMLGCSGGSPSQTENSPKLGETDQFKQYWFVGKAEINSYHMNQSRYGETREGKAMLIFVTEDFSNKKQVKLDNPDINGNDKVKVLKLNFTKNFVTGIYPYSMMLSVFSPIDRRQKAHALKVTMSSQEWCGQTFAQLNFRRNKYSFTGHSYFEKEGEEKSLIKAAWLEDELWNLIRLNPENLPTGEVNLIPGLFFSRLEHCAVGIHRATITREDVDEEIHYRIYLPDLERSLEIRITKEFPNRILGWEETFTERGEKFKTEAVLDKSLMIDYWKKNGNEFLYLRDSLGLSKHNF